MSDNTSFEELALTTGDVGAVTEEVVRDRVEEVVEGNYVYRNAFMDYPAQGVNSNIIKIPVPKQDSMEEFSHKVGENSEYPREEGDYTQKTLEFEKYGFEIPISMEAEQDTFINLTQDQVDRQSKQLAKDLNKEAFKKVDANVSQTVSASGGSDGVMSFGDVLAGRKELKKNQYDPDLLIADLEAVHDLMADNNFVQAGDVQDEIRRSGVVGRILGLDIVEADDDNNIVGTEDDAGAYLIDTDYFGYEGQKVPITSEQYTEDQTESEIFRIKTRMGWTVVQPEAAVKVEG